jgi:ABC-type nitrate/sulfonate/bicarbonate transport system substrate-binding protein
MKKILLPASLALLLVLSFLYLFVIDEGTKDKQGQVKMDSVSIATTSSGALLYITQEQGFFKEVGLDVKLESFASGKAAGKALLDDQVQFSTTADAGFVSYSFIHKDLRILGTVASANLSELVARKDRNITTVSHLKGKKIGVSKDTTSEYFLKTFLIDNLIPFDAVQTVYLKPKDIIESMLSGEIDACHIWQPYVYEIKKNLESNYVSWPGQGGQEYHFLLLAKQEWLKQNKDIARRLFKALLKGEAFVEARKEQAKTSYKKLTGLEGEALDLKWKGMRLHVSLEQSLLLDLETQAKFRIDDKQDDKKDIPNYLDFIYFDALESANPNSVTIFQ